MAVEFALLLPVLLLLVLGIMEFSHAYNAQISVTQAAREGARYLAIHEDAAGAAAQAKTGAPSLDPAAMTILPTYLDANGAPASRCGPGVSAKITISYTERSLTGFFGVSSRTITGEGAMQCGG